MITEEIPLPVDPMGPEDDADSTPVAPRLTGQLCGNCGTPLLGEHCYHCGQPDHGLVRHFSSVMGDLADTLLQIDTRLTRTVAPLLLRPGYLSMEYFAGRRVRYVSPVRLFFFISVVAFFVAQWSVDASGNGHNLMNMDDNGINTATTVAAVEQQRDLALKGTQTGKTASIGVPGAQAGLTAAEVAIRKEADSRIAELNAAKAAGKPPPEHVEPLTFNDTPWDPVKNPIHFDAMPAFVNKWFNQLGTQAQGNLARIRQDPRLLIDAALSAMPSTLFILLPLFAVLLKVIYYFKRRLYMEHFIVALHSHSFLCLAFLLVLVLSGLDGVTQTSWTNGPIVFTKVVLMIWMPLYLLLMQKRVYGQGWLMTTLKYCTIATVYSILLVFGVLATFAVKLVWL